MTSTLDRPPTVPEPPSATGATSVAADARGRGRLQRLARGPEQDPAWARPALVALLVATGVLYLWGLGTSGWANSFYSAAVQAGTKSWKAFFFGSSDAANSITVDKPPVSLWVMGISARLFGVNAWSILVPQALAGVASVGVLYAAIKRWFGAGPGLIAGAVLALTPVATLMFRFNNPDAVLVLLLVLGAYALTRALERASTGWLVLAWSFVGFGFLTKMLQALLVAPAFALVYLVCAPTSFRRRFLQSAAGFVALVASAGWWIAIVELWPASSRPYIGGSQENSILELTLGYNGLGRLTGNETGSVGGGGGPNGAGMWGATGWNRLFNSDFGTQAGWLIPTALVLLAAGLWLRRRAPRVDRARTALLLWGGWLVVTALAFSYAKGIIHAYYTVALAPAIGAVIGIGLLPWWQRRDELWGRIVLAGTLALTTTFSYSLLHRTPDWAPLLQQAVLFGGFAVAAAIALAPSLRGKVGAAVAAGALVLALAGPAAYSLQTASVAHGGSIPSAGPGAGGGPGGGRGPGGMPGAFPGGFPGGLPGGAATGAGANAGGLLEGSTSSAAIDALLQQDVDQYRWAAAAVGSNSAAGYQLSSDQPVMPVGGFNGSDPSPTLAEFQAYVADGDIHWFIAGGGGMGGGGMGGGPGGMTSSTTSAISTWVSSNFTATTVDGVTLYDLTAPTSS